MAQQQQMVAHQQQMDAMRNEVTVQLAQIQKTLSGSSLNSSAAPFNPSGGVPNYNLSNQTPHTPLQSSFANYPSRPAVPQNVQQSMTPQPLLTPQQLQQYQQFLQSQSQVTQPFSTKKKGNKCDDCVAKKLPKCNHCFGCGKQDHKWEACNLKG